MKEIDVAKNICERLNLAGHQGLLCGGCVRDMLLGLESHDIDIATSASCDDIEKIFKRTLPVGKQFGVIIVLEGNMQFEIATFRKDSKESDGRRPNSIEFSSMQEDAKRRDLTINGLFFDPISEKIFDFVGGEKDLKDRIIQFIGNAQERIDEDKLRMLRAIRFAARFGFDIDQETKDIIRKNANKISQVSKERVKAELDKMLGGKKPSIAFNLLREVNLLGQPWILPQVDALWNQEQSVKWHSEGAEFDDDNNLVKLGNVGIHTMMVLDNTREKTDNIPTLWGALLHDVGKPDTSFLNDEGNISCHGHDKVGAKIAEGIMTNLCASNDEKTFVTAIVKDHMRIGTASEMKKSTLRKIIAQPHFDELMHVFKSDCESSIPLNKNKEDHKFDSFVFLTNFIENMEDVKELPKPFVSGKDLISLGLKPGPLFKEILNKISDMQLEGEVENFEQALEKAKEFISKI